MSLPAPFTPPIAIPTGQVVVWSLATTNVASAGMGCSASSTNTTGQNGSGFSSPLGNNFSQVDWYDYATPSALTRNGVVIHGIYPTIIGEGSNANTNFTMQLNKNGSGGGIIGPPLVGSISGQWYRNIGTDPTVIPAILNEFYTLATLPVGPINDFFNTTFVGVAIYIDAPPLPSVFVNLGKQQYADVGFND